MTEKNPPPATTRSARSAPAAAGGEPYRVTDWAGHPNYGCPFCVYTTLEGEGAIVTHIAERHREQAIA